MILSGKKIVQEYTNGVIDITPFDIASVTTNSYDLKLGHKFIRYKEDVLDPRGKNLYEEFVVGEEGVALNKGDFILGHSEELVGSKNYVPIIHARSGIARLGLFVHVTADLIDIGSFGQVTFQLYACLPIRIYPGMKVGQVSFWVPHGHIECYNGKYQGSRGPQASKIHTDFISEMEL